ncbi:MAG TPA: hypothetical protein VHO29_11385 [Marmoricola sp.]|nr:hypothetical protein [Marmoricola sp.]
MRKVIFSACVMATGAVIPLLGVAPAQASGCITQYRWTAIGPNADTSETFNASIGCDGVWGYWTRQYTDYVKGEYYSGGWQNSSYGWQLLPNTYGSGKKIVGNTVDGRRCRGVSYTYSQSVYYAF